MQGSDIDSYIVDFDRLIDEAGYSKFDMGVMINLKRAYNPHYSGRSYSTTCRHPKP